MLHRPDAQYSAERVCFTFNVLYVYRSARQWTSDVSADVSRAEPPTLQLPFSCCCCCCCCVSCQAQRQALAAAVVGVNFDRSSLKSRDLSAAALLHLEDAARAIKFLRPLIHACYDSYTINCACIPCTRKDVF